MNIFSRANVKDSQLVSINKFLQESLVHLSKLDDLDLTYMLKSLFQNVLMFTGIVKEVVCHYCGNLCMNYFLGGIPMAWSYYLI